MAAMSLPVHTSLGELNPVLYVCSHGKEMRRGGRGGEKQFPGNTLSDLVWLVWWSTQQVPPSSWRFNLAQHKWDGVLS